MVSLVNEELTLTALGGEPRTVASWLTTFQLVTVVLDPYTNESAWLLPTAGRFLDTFKDADCRVSWTVTADEADAKRFLGPWADEFLTFVDPDRSFVRALELERTPALVYLRQDLAVIGKAEGWQPQEWEDLGALIGKVNSWSSPKLPKAGDPGPFAGAPAAG